MDPKCLEPKFVCKTCGDTKPIFDFYMHKSTGNPRAHCKACIYQMQRDYAKRKPEIVKASAAKSSKEYRKRHPEKVSEQFSTWREARKEDLNKRTAEWRKANHGAVNHYKAKRRALSRLATPSWANVAEIKEIYAEAKAKGLVVDHCIPLRGKDVCGLHVEYNLQLMTRHENAKKYNKHTLG